MLNLHTFANTFAQSVVNVQIQIVQIQFVPKNVKVDKAIQVMRENVTNGTLSPIIVECLLDNYDAIDAERDIQSHIQGRRYFESLKNTPEE